MQIENKISQEDILIEEEFNALIEDYLNTNHRGKVEKITRAFNFAKTAHQGIKRRSGEPYISHPLAVARIVVKEIGLGSTSICSALLHDVVEDTDYTVEDIKNLFGSKIAQIVDGLTKISGGVFAKNASSQAENFRKLILTMSEDVRVIIIKIADRLHNMRTLDSMPPAKQFKIAGETQYIYAPLAHRLGLFRIKTELENLSFKYEHPDTYKTLEEKLAKDAPQRDEFYRVFSKPIEEKLTEMGYEFFFKARIKTVFSIWEKMSKRNIPFEDVYDILALRIIFKPKPNMTEKTQCWLLYSAITAIYKPHPERIRDWVSTPKANGYEALHITVMGPEGKWVEIQIRSERMNEIAERGLAAHWKYKTGETEDSELDRWLKEIKELLKNPEPNAVDFMDTFKLNLFASEIFVFTPLGDIKTIPQGCTTLDFAFILHSDIGFHCIGAKVNHKLVPLNHELKSGDQVEILTSKKQEPQIEWESFATTAHAKSKIRAWFKKKENITIREGKERLKQIMASLNVKLNNSAIVRLLNHYKITEPKELFLRAGKGYLNFEEIPKVFKKESQNLFTKYLKIIGGAAQAQKAEKKKTGQEKIEIEKVDRKKTHLLSDNQKGFILASCCHPIPGDDVLGYVNEDEKIVVHKHQCPVASKLKSNEGDRIVSVQWDMHKQLSFEEPLEIKGIDSKGILISILKVISENHDVNMSAIDIKSQAGIFIGRFQIFVHDTQDLEDMRKDILKIPGIKSVQRVSQDSTDNKKTREDS